MNWQEVASVWSTVRGHFKERWGLLSENDLQVIDGKKEKLIGRLQYKYGLERDQAEYEVNSFIQPLSFEEFRAQEQPLGESELRAIKKEECDRCM